MGKMNDIPLKEKYRLWWEYLQRGDNFKRFEAGMNNPNKEQRQKIAWEIWTKYQFSYWFFNELLWLHPSFDEWWNNEFKEREKRSKKVEEVTPSVARLKKYFEDLRNNSINPEWLAVEADIQTDEVGLGEWLLLDLRGDLLIRIDGIHLWDFSDLENEIKKIIKEKLKELGPTSSAPTKKMRYEQVKRYLEIYDRITSLKEKEFTWEKITKEFYPKLTKRYEEKDIAFKPEGLRIRNRLESHERRLKMEYAKAKKIISNAEKGQFPGKY